MDGGMGGGMVRRKEDTERMTGTVEGMAEQLEGHRLLEGWRAQRVLSSPGLCPGLSLQCPQIPAWAEDKHPGRGQRQTQHHFVPLPPLLWNGRKSGNESAGEGRFQVGAAPFFPVLLFCSSAGLEHPMDETKGPLSPMFSPSPSGCSFFLPSLHVWDANAGSELSILPPDV